MPYVWHLATFAREKWQRALIREERLLKHTLNQSVMTFYRNNLLAPRAFSPTDEKDPELGSRRKKN